VALVEFDWAESVLLAEFETELFVSVRFVGESGGRIGASEKGGVRFREEFPGGSVTTAMLLTEGTAATAIPVSAAAAWKKPAGARAKLARLTCDMEAKGTAKRTEIQKR